MTAPALTARGLVVEGSEGAPIVRGIDLDLRAGAVVALVGPSGAGKSLTMRALARLLPPGLRSRGEIRIGETDLLALRSAELRKIRGATLAWISQDATASLNPTVTVGVHLAETLRAHGRLPRGEVRSRSADALVTVGLDDPDQLLSAYPFQLSGGQAQRVAIALATVSRPSILLADEITAELDVVSQAMILEQLRSQANAGRAVLLVTHDLAVAARWADEVVVLQDGQVVDHGPTDQVLGQQRAALTRELVAAARRSEHGG